MPKQASSLTFKQKSVILSVLTGVGVIVTGALSARCAKKDDADRPVKERVITYIPAIASSVATIGLVVATAKVSSEEVAALTVTCAGLAAKMSDYRDATIEHIGSAEEVDKIFARKQAERAVEHTDDTDVGLETFVDTFSGASFKAKYDDVVKAEERLEAMYADGEPVCWCDIFYLSTESTDASDSTLGGEIGWSKDAIDDLHDVGTGDIPNLEFYNDLKEDGRWWISYNYEPVWGFYEY